MKILLFIVLALSLDITSAIGCKNKCGLPATCSCPCKAYQINDERGTCAKCEHEGNSKRGEMEVDAKAGVEKYNFFTNKKH